MPNVATFYRDYIFANSNDRTRLKLQHDISRPHFLEIIEQVMNDYGLAERLEKAKTRGEKVRILDFGCGEGMFLHDLAEILEKRGLLEAADLNGIDNDRAAIMTADEYCQISQPPRPYLHFFVHDGTHPLEDCLGLPQDDRLEFDFIFAILVLEHLPDARQHLERLYRNLKPGGVIYLSDFVAQEGGDYGWVLPHPVMLPIGRILNQVWLNKNNGEVIALEIAGWLRQLGAEKVQATPNLAVMGGDTKAGMDMFRNFLLGIRNACPFLIARNIITQAQLDEMLETLYRELTRESTGRTGHMDILALKPLA